MFLGLSVVVLIALSGVIIADETKYSDKYDYVDVDAILANSRQREAYYKCFLGTDKCHSADAEFFRDRFPEAVLTGCKKCTARQSVMFDKLSDWYTKHEPKKYDAIVEMSLKKLSKKSQDSRKII